MDSQQLSTRNHLKIVLFGWISMIGTDFLLHAGILYPIYNQDHPFLLDNLTAFYLIPVGYLSFLLMAGLLYWLFIQLHISGKAAIRFSFIFGALTWGSLILGLFSIADAPFWLLIGWFIGQTIEITIAGYVMGIKLEEYTTGKEYSVNKLLISYVILCLLLGIIIQNLYNNY